MGRDKLSWAPPSISDNAEESGFYMTSLQIKIDISLKESIKKENIVWMYFKFKQLFKL